MAGRLKPVPLLSVSAGALAAGCVLHLQYRTEPYEFAGFVTGVISVYLIAVEHIFNWPIGVVNVLIYAWVFFGSRLYADMSLQFFFLALNIHGWYQWVRGGVGSGALRVSRIRPMIWPLILVAWIAGSAIYIPVITHYGGASPAIDSTLTVGSIIAQLMLNKKKLENWILWIVIDIAYIPLYVSRHLVATAVLYGLFLSLAGLGLVEWTRTWKAEVGAQLPA